MLALHECLVESVIERGRTCKLAQQAQKGLCGRLEQGEGASEDKVGVRQAVALEPEVEQQGVNCAF